MEDNLYKVDGYFVKEGKATKEDIDYIEGKIIELLENEGFLFCGTSRVEEND